MVEQVPGLVSDCWPTDTSVVDDWDDWDVEPDANGEGGVPLYSAAQKARAVALAGQSLRMLTGYRVGGCPITVRPCRKRCRERTWRVFPTPGTGSTPWMPVSLGGQWLNLGCGHSGACGCVGIAELALPPSAQRIVEVKVDGMLLDPTAYRLDRGGRLVRLDGDAWPLCQNIGAPDTELNTWSVTYLAGAEVDGLGAAMAGILAGQFVRACSGGACDLPVGVTTVVRQGVTLTLGLGAFPDGKTGLREVDAYVMRYNPHGLTSPPQVYSYDVHRYRVEARRNSYVPAPDVIDGGSP